MRVQYHALGRPTPDSRRVASGWPQWDRGVKLSLFLETERLTILLKRPEKERTEQVCDESRFLLSKKKLALSFKFFPNLSFIVPNQPA